LPGPKSEIFPPWFIDEPLWLHNWLGYTAATLVTLRVIWGFVGPQEARFSSFVRGPRVVLQYFLDLIRLSSKRYLGHSPAGGAMVIALLFMLGVTTITGMANLAVERGQGPLAGLVTRRLLPCNLPALRTRLFRPLVQCGEYSLVIYCVSVLISFAAHPRTL
jgi:hypothetical protein